MNSSTTILFQGDSITDGNRFKDESTRWDLNHQIGHAYPYVIASLLGSAAPERNLRFLNRGVSANTIHLMQRRWVEDTLRLQPDILSILIGVNDVCGTNRDEQHNTPEQFENTYRQLLDEALRAKEDIHFVLIEPFLLKAGELDCEWKRRYRLINTYQSVVRRVAEDYGAVFVPLQEKLNRLCEKQSHEYWVWDGVHPTEAGHGIIAREWLKATGLWELAISG